MPVPELLDQVKKNGLSIGAGKISIVCGHYTGTRISGDTDRVVLELELIILKFKASNDCKEGENKYIIRNMWVFNIFDDVYIILMYRLINFVAFPVYHAVRSILLGFTVCRAGLISYIVKNVIFNGMIVAL